MLVDCGVYLYESLCHQERKSFWKPERTAAMAHVCTPDHVWIFVKDLKVSFSIFSLDLH